jgi:hypothetical protein
MLTNARPVCPQHCPYFLPSLAASSLPQTLEMHNPGVMVLVPIHTATIVQVPLYVMQRHCQYLALISHPVEVSVCLESQSSNEQTITSNSCAFVAEHRAKCHRQITKSKSADAFRRRITYTQTVCIPITICCKM